MSNAVSYLSFKYPICVSGAQGPVMHFTSRERERETTKGEKKRERERERERETVAFAPSRGAGMGYTTLINTP